jgi:Domain of unknown function (DUF5919)
VSEKNSDVATNTKLHSLLNQLGLILGPTTVVAFFCQFVDMSQRNVAAVSIASIFFLALCLNRYWVNKNISSALAVGLLIAGFGIYYFTYENILIKDTGLIRYYKSSNDYIAGALESDVEKSRVSILFFGTNFHISAQDRRMAIFSALKRGVKIRYLLLNPDGPQIHQVAIDFDSNPKNLADECRSGLRDLEYLQSTWSEMRKNEKTPGEIEIRTFDSTPRLRGYFFDPGPDGKAYIVPYINKVNSPDSPGFLFGNFDSGVAKIYYYGVSRLWQDAVPFNKS